MNDKLEMIEAENQLLRRKVEAFEKSNEKSIKFKYYLFSKIGLFLLLGGRLRNNLIEASRGNISREQLIDIIIAIFFRLTRIGIFAFLAALIPILLLAGQNWLISIQNGKIDEQNERIKEQTIRLDQQTQLLEADRRSNLVFEKSEVLNRISDELANKDSLEVRALSPQLVGRIIALSEALKPYKYLDFDGDSLIANIVSPERGQLLISLIQSRLDENTYDQIYSGANFSYAELNNSNLEEAYLSGVNLEGSILIGANLYGAKCNNTRFTNSNLKDANINLADFSWADISDSDLRVVLAFGVNMYRSNIYGSDIRNVDLSTAAISSSRAFEAQREYFLEAGIIEDSLDMMEWLPNPAEKEKYEWVNWEEK